MVDRSPAAADSDSAEENAAQPSSAGASRVRSRSRLHSPRHPLSPPHPTPRDSEACDPRGVCPSPPTRVTGGWVNPSHTTNSFLAVVYTTVPHEDPKPAARRPPTQPGGCMARAQRPKDERRRQAGTRTSTTTMRTPPPPHSTTLPCAAARCPRALALSGNRTTTMVRITPTHDMQYKARLCMRATD